MNTSSELSREGLTPGLSDECLEEGSHSSEVDGLGEGSGLLPGSASPGFREKKGKVGSNSPPPYWLVPGTSNSRLNGPFNKVDPSSPRLHMYE